MIAWWAYPSQSQIITNCRPMYEFKLRYLQFLMYWHYERLSRNHILGITSNCRRLHSDRIRSVRSSYSAGANVYAVNYYYNICSLLYAVVVDGILWRDFKLKHTFWDGMYCMYWNTYMYWCDYDPTNSRRWYFHTFSSV